MTDWPSMAFPFDPPMRTFPEVREKILAMFKQARERYAAPFSEDRLPAVSLNESHTFRAASYGNSRRMSSNLLTLTSRQVAG